MPPPMTPPTTPRPAARRPRVRGAPAGITARPRGTADWWRQPILVLPMVVLVLATAALIAVLVVVPG